MDSSTDMLPDEGLGSKMNPKIQIKTAGADAGLAAVAMAKGSSFRCARIGADVTPKSCVNRYTAARTGGLPHSPCLECAKVRTMMKKAGEDFTPPPQLQKAVAEMVATAKEVLTMPAPAKALAPTPAGPEDFTKGFEIYSAKASRKAQRVVFAKLNAKAISFSAAAVAEFGLKDFVTADAYYRPGVIRFVFRKDDGGEFTPTKRMVDRTELKLSAAGFVKAWKIPAAAIGKAFNVTGHGPGLLEVRLDVGEG